MGTVLAVILLPLRLAGRLRVTARKPDGRPRPLTGWQSNLILDAGLDQIAQNSTWLDCCQVGRSGVAPAAGQAALIEPLAGTANRISANSAAANAAPWRGFSQITYRFPVGAVVEPIREIGIGSSSVPGSPLYARALVRTAQGVPTGVVPQPDEYIEVEYECSVSAPLADTTGTVLIDGIERGYTARAARVSSAAAWAPYRASSFAAAGQAVRARFTDVGGSFCAAYSGGLGAITSVPEGSSGNCAGGGPQPYVPGSRRATGLVRWDLDSANFAGGIRSIYFQFGPESGSGGNSIGAFQVEFSSPAPKTAALGFQFGAGIEWGRA